MDKKQITFIKRNANKLTVAKISEHLKLPYQQVWKFIKHGTLPKEKTALIDVRQQVTQSEKQAQERKSYKETIIQMSDELDDLQKKYNLATSLETAIKPTVIKAQSKSPDESVAFAIASDWHYEEVVRSSETNGLNEFNLRIADARINAFFANTVKLLKKESTHAPINTLVLALLGDFITNANLHDDTPEYCGLGVFEAINAVENHIIGGIQYILDNTTVNLVIPTSVGNHTRVTKKVHVTRETSNNLETIVYAHIARHFRDSKRVRVLQPESYLQYLTLWDNYTVCFHHGHAVNYGGGIGGLTIPMNKAIANWQRNKHANLYVNGHFHQKMIGSSFISNGSLIGYNAFAVFIKASYEPASQWFFLVNKEYKGVTITAPIFLN